MKVRLEKDFRFECAHSLPKVPPGHRCGKLHGHSIGVSVCVEGEVNPETGWLYDHAKISEAMKPLVATLDHSFLNDIEGLENSTAENLAAWLWKRLKPSLPELVELTIHETPTARCIYRGE